MFLSNNLNKISKLKIIKKINNNNNNVIINISNKNIKKNMNYWNYKYYYFQDYKNNNIHKIFKRNMWKVSSSIKMKVENETIINKVYDYNAYNKINREYHQSIVPKSFYMGQRANNETIDWNRKFFFWDKIIMKNVENVKIKNTIHNIWRAFNHDLIVEGKEYNEIKNGEIVEMVELYTAAITTKKKIIYFWDEKISVVELLKDQDIDKTYCVAQVLLKQNKTKKEYKELLLRNNIEHNEKKEILTNQVSYLINIKNEPFKVIDLSIPLKDNYGILTVYTGKFSLYENKLNKLILKDET